MASRPLSARHVLLMLLALGSAPAGATTFVRMDVAELAHRSEAAVIATVEAVSAHAAPGGAIVTRVTLTPEQVVLGTLPPGELVLEEPGGRLGGITERVFGAPDYCVGERVLVFVHRTRRGTLRTTGMAMGRYRIETEGGDTVARRETGDALVLDPDSGRPVALPTERLADLLRALPRRPGPDAPGREFRRAPRRVPGKSSPFTYLGLPSRWFEPDAGQPVQLRIDPRGDASLGAAVTQQAVQEALAAWNTVGSALRLTDGVLDAPLPFAGCLGDSRVVFNDPFDEIGQPDACRGVLGIGGYCYSDEPRAVGGQVFQRIRLGKVVIADGWGGCPQWTACNLAEVITHEIGHAIGLGHSNDRDATMAPSADFDGRCAALGHDDIAGVTAIYPMAMVVTATATPTATLRRTDPPTLTPTPQRSGSPTVPPVGVRGVRGYVRYFTTDLPVPAVEVAFRGSGSRNVMSHGGGDYGVDMLKPGNWDVLPAKHGDHGAAVTALDAAWVLQAAAGRRTLDAERAIACDATGSGTVTTLDALHILQLAMGRAPRLPAGERCGSDFVFFPDPASSTDQPVAAQDPQLGSDPCVPGALRYAPLHAQVIDQNFRAALLGDCTGDWRPSARRSTKPLLAPDGTALKGATLKHLRGPLSRMTVGIIASSEVHALNIEVRFDPERITPRRVRGVHVDAGAAVASGKPTANRFTVALASGVPLPTDGRVVLAIDFAATTPDFDPEAARAWSARVDDRLVSVVIP